MHVFGKDIKTRHGDYRAGQPLPAEWETRETREQLVEQFGKDVLVEAQSVSSEQMAARLSAIESSLKQIKEALGLKSEAKKPLSAAKGSA